MRLQLKRFALRQKQNDAAGRLMQNQMTLEPKRTNSRLLARWSATVRRWNLAWTAAGLCIAMHVGELRAQPSDASPGASSSAPLPGHSTHAEAFNEGPRQAAYLMRGMGNVHWQTSTPSPMAQRFFDQGLSQLHGFWFFEAERSFRQAASIDPDCAIHYWGMARANVENPTRSAGFIQQAMNRIASANQVERRLIEAWNRRVQDWPHDPPKEGEGNDATSKKKSKPWDVSEATRDQQKQRFKDYVQALEELALDNRDDVEIKAMLVLQYWQNQGEGIEIQSHAAIDALLTDIFRINPRHPAHHFRIHLWDYRKEELALTAAALCGPSAPGIAHMWHMPGHTYSRLHRYADASWQQEASARVDHAHMMRDGVMPDQIHNFAHNNEWLIRNWIYLGKVRDAIALAKNMIELPRHPEYNDPNASGSAAYGRQRLIGALTAFHRWNELAEVSNSIYMTANDDPSALDRNQVWKAIAMVNIGQIDSAKEDLARFIALRRTWRAELDSLDPPTSDAHNRPPTLATPFDPPEDLFGSPNNPSLPETVNKEFDESKAKDASEEERARQKTRHATNYRYYELGIGVAALESHLAAAAGDFRTAVRRSNEARSLVDELLRIEWCSRASEHALAVRKAKEAFDAGTGQILPASLAVWVAHQAILAQPQSPVVEEWKTLRQSAIEQCAGLASGADPDLEWVERAKVIAREVAPQTEWGLPRKLPQDLGDRPPLDSLGPVRWSPALAPVWSLNLSTGEEQSSKRMTGKPYIVILYLGFGCLHCAEQLAAFSPEVEAFRQEGIDVIGITTESPKSLLEGLSRYDKEMRIPLASNSDLDIFKAFRCFDDFEGQPLHGTILVDGTGRIRWQDIGYKPFMNVQFLLQESKRLLQLP